MSEALFVFCKFVHVFNKVIQGLPVSTYFYGLLSPGNSAVIHGVSYFVLMNSFRTREDTIEALAPHTELAVEGLPLDFLQNREPKLRADDLTPVDWPADPSLEWCPPGHGDLYTALDVSGRNAGWVMSLAQMR